MNYLKKIITENKWALLAVIFFSLLAGRGLIGSGYFNMHDDLQMMRQLEMEKCFQDLQIPCRWVPDMGYSYGFPLFNFYPPLPYIVGQVVRTVGFSFVDTAKIVFLLAFLLSGISMYFLGRQFFGKWGGILASVFYVWAPYHSVDIYVRGAMNEAWALVFFPAILLFSYKLLATGAKLDRTKRNSFVIGLSLSWFGLLLSHNLMVMIFTPIFAVWCLMFFFKFKAWSKIPTLLVSGVLALGLAAFFTLPVMFEQKFVHADSLVQGYYEYTAHFATVNQLLLSRFWGYGPSVWLNNDGMSFQVGHIHWMLSIIIFVMTIFYFVRAKKEKRAIILNTIYPILYTIFIAWISVFMIHSKSTPLWQLIPPLKFTQFPWRFLTLAILGFSFAAGSIVLFIPQKLRALFSLVLIFGLILFNWNYFQVEKGKLGPLTDQEKFTGAAWDLQRTAGIYDYLPQTAKENPRDGQNGVAEVVGNSHAQITNAIERTNFQKFTVNVIDDGAVIRINTYLFPGWKVYLDGKETAVRVPDEEKWGRMYITVPKGNHEIAAKFGNTPIRTLSNLISLVSFSILTIYVFKQQKSFSKKKR